MTLNTTTDIYGIRTPKTVSRLTKAAETKLYGFKFPFLMLEDGRFLKKSSNIDLLKGHLKQLLLTVKGQRVMLPNYGTNLRRYLMEPLDQATLSQIRREILESFSRYAPGIVLTKLQVFPSTQSSGAGSHSLIVKLFCEFKEEETLVFDLILNIT